MSAFRRCRPAGAALAILLLGGCSLPEATEGIVNGYDPENANINDPFESQNRSIYALNDYADRTVFRPVASAYVKAAPAPARSCLENIFDNLKEPIRTVAHLISFDDAAAASSSSRFLVNTIGGGFGCVDVAGDAMGIEEEEGDIGLSVRSWLDNEHSVYLMMPLFGPTTLIDGSMRYAGTSHLDPLIVARSRRDDFHKEDRHWMSRNPLRHHGEIAAAGDVHPARRRRPGQDAGRFGFARRDFLRPLPVRAPFLSRAAPAPVSGDSGTPAGKIRETVLAPGCSAAW